MKYQTTDGSANGTTTRKVLYVLVAFCSLALFLSLLSLDAESFTIGPNYRNVSVDTRVNITDAKPEILDISVASPITLTAGGRSYFTCNMTIRDWNGFADIDTVNATAFHSDLSSFGASDDNNTHYTNTSCVAYQQSGFYANYSCSFGVYYYAVNGTWNCTGAVNDSFGFTASNFTNFDIDPLYALNVSPLIDYGQMAVEEWSENKTANVTNLGNVPINVSVYGYGATPGDGLAFVCAIGTISIENERYSINSSHTYSEKTPLATSPSQISGLTVPKQEFPSFEKTNTTYWQLYVPPNPFGICNGTVVFQAELSD